jgi:hypothetical protein
VADANRAVPPRGGPSAGSSAGSPFPAPHASPAERIAGKYYLIIDRMQGIAQKDRADAEAIITYLKEKGESATLNKLANRYLVWSLRPFDSPRSPEAMEFARSIERLGQQYRPPRGRSKYTFSQHKPGGELDPSYYRAD